MSVAPSTRLLPAGLHRGWRVRRHPPDLLRRAAAEVVESSTNERAASLILGVSRNTWTFIDGVLEGRAVLYREDDFVDPVASCWPECIASGEEVQSVDNRRSACGRPWRSSGDARRGL